MGFAEECARITDERNDTEHWVEFAVKHICGECLKRAKQGLQEYSFYDFEHGVDYYPPKTEEDGFVPRWNYEPNKNLIPVWAKEMFDADKNHMYYERWKPLIIKGLIDEGFKVSNEYRWARVTW